MVAWEAFKRLRRLNVEKWLVNRGVTSYELLVEKLRIVDVTPPSFEEYERFKLTPAATSKKEDVKEIAVEEKFENKEIEVVKEDIQTSKQAIIEVGGKENTPQKKRKKIYNESK